MTATAPKEVPHGDPLIDRALAGIVGREAERQTEIRNWIHETQQARDAFWEEFKFYASYAHREDELNKQTDGKRLEATMRLKGQTNPATSQPHSATSAEKFMDTDHDLAAHHALVREVVWEKNLAHGRMLAAWNRMETAREALRALSGFPPLPVPMPELPKLEGAR